MKTEIRRWKTEDAQDLSAALNNQNVQKNMRDGIPFPYTRADAEDFITSMLNSDKNTCFSFAITADGKAIGSIGVFRKENIHFRTAEMGYYISEEYWGKGITTEAVKQICRLIFDNTDIIRIFAEPFEYNLASCRVLEKNGFEFEGTLRCNAVKNGQILNMKLYSLIKH